MTIKLVSTPAKTDLGNRQDDTIPICENSKRFSDLLLRAHFLHLRKILTVLVMLLCSFATLSGRAECNDIQSENNLVDGTSFVHKLCSEFETWTDYSCTTELLNYKPDKTTFSSSRFFFKKGPTVRIEVIGGGFRDGCVIVRTKEGSIKGKGGTWMGGIQMKLDPDSRMLILPSGANVTKGDFPELFQSLKEKLEHGYSCRLSAQPFEDATSSKKVLMLEVHDADKVLKSRVYISADEHIPIRWESFLQDKLRTATTFKNLKVNAGLSDDLFRL